MLQTAQCRHPDATKDAAVQPVKPDLCRKRKIIGGRRRDLREKA